LGKRKIFDSLKEAREDRKYSQGQLAKAAGITRSYYNRMELGKRGENVSMKTVYGLATALDIAPHEVLRLIEVARNSNSVE
jgi:transcriptional regulator with XRE-family HTH domain